MHCHRQRQRRETVQLLYTNLFQFSDRLMCVFPPKQNCYILHRSLTYFHFLVSTVRMLVTTASITRARCSRSVCLYTFHDGKLIIISNISIFHPALPTCELHFYVNSKKQSGGFKSIWQSVRIGYRQC